MTIHRSIFQHIFHIFHISHFVSSFPWFKSSRLQNRQLTETFYHETVLFNASSLTSAPSFMPWYKNWAFYNLNIFKIKVRRPISKPQGSIQKPLQLKKLKHSLISLVEYVFKNNSRLKIVPFFPFQDIWIFKAIQRLTWNEIRKDY